MGVHDGHRARKREQFLSAGPDAFADHELLELLLYHAIPRRDTNPIAHQLIDEFGSLKAVFEALPEDLKRVDGIGENAAMLLKLAPAVYRRALVSASDSRTALNSAERLGEFFRDVFAGEKNEIMYQLCLDVKWRKLNLYKLAEGDVMHVSLSVRRIMENALRCNACVVVLAHNHPNGEAFPSSKDIRFTYNILDALRAMDIVLADHIIVAGSSYISLRESQCVVFQQ